MIAVTSLEHIHKKGRFGNYQKQEAHLEKIAKILTIKTI